MPSFPVLLTTGSANAAPSRMAFPERPNFALSRYFDFWPVGTI